MARRVERTRVPAMSWPPEHIEPLPSPRVDETWERLRQATIDLALERGYWVFDVADIVDRTGVTQAEFDARFSSKRDCCDRSYEANLADFDRAMVVPCLAAPTWRAGIRLGMYGAAEYLSHHERERRFGELRMREGRPMELAARDRYLQRVVDLIDLGRCETDNPDSHPRSTAEGVVGSIQGLMLHRLRESDGGGPGIEIIDDVVYLAVRPYIGHRAAIRERRASASHRAPVV